VGTRRERLAALSASIDAPRARALRERFSEGLRDLGRPGDHRVAIEVATLLATAYPALEQGLARDREACLWLAAQRWSATKPRGELLREARARALGGGPPYDPDRVRRELRRYAWRERARIALRELLPHDVGGAQVDQTAGELAALADATIQVAFDEALAHAIARLGAPVTSDGTPSRFVVLGMGKLGGEELNAGSDVDLVYFYDTDDGEVVQGDAPTSTSLHELWTRVARRLTATLEDVTDDGFVWRVDLRLRPEGGAGPLVNSLAAAERYYEAFGRTWERAALLRARPVAGYLALGDELLASLRDFVWRKRVDPTIASEMVHLVERARSELGDGAGHDVKLGVGGIREAEFFAQTLALVWGGRDPSLRVRGTLQALARLEAAGLCTGREAAEVGDAYLFLRRVEHAVQNATGIHTHRVPTAPEERLRIARIVGQPDVTAFDAELELHRVRVAARFGTIAPEGKLPPSRWTAALSALERGDEEALAAALAGAAYAWLPAAFDPRLADPTDDPHAARVAGAARWLLQMTRHPDDVLGVRSRDTFPDLAESLLDALADAADLEQAARQLRLFFARVRTPAVYVRLLAGDPRALRRLVSVLGASRFVGDALANQPELGDAIMFSHDVPTPEGAREEVVRAAEPPRGVDADDEEALIGRLRAAKIAVTVRVALADLAGEIDVQGAGRVLTALADASLDVACRHALGAGGALPRGLAVVAMGKLGSCEIGYGSDLDVLFVYDGGACPDPDPAAFYTRVARRIIRLVTTFHAEGPGYELDTRLRPSGNQGLLVSSLEGFARHHGFESARDAAPSSARAATWERMALVRARAAAGDPALGDRVVRLARAVAYAGGGDRAAMAEEVRHIRERVAREAAPERPGRHDVKLGWGGLLEVEFAVQLLQVSIPAPPRARTGDVLGALAALREAELVDPAVADALRDGYLFLRALEQRIRVVHAAANHVLDEHDPAIYALARRMGIRDREGPRVLLSRLREVTARVRAAFDSVTMAPERAVDPHRATPLPPAPTASAGPARDVGG
jgi:glutamate-ammonia-ligase adenylyltransferase